MFKRTEDTFHKAIDNIDSKWAHPEMRDMYDSFSDSAMAPVMTGYLGAVDHTKTLEERLEFQKQYLAMFPSLEAGMTEEVEGKRVEFGGCLEEPEYRSNAYICAPKKRKKKKAPVIMYIVGGSTVCCMEGLAPAADLAKKFGAVVVVPHYRTCVEAPYPAAINDLHAAYAYIVDHAEEYNIDADKILMMGASSGAQLGLCLSFRLKRYGYSPRGMVAMYPITDERGIYPSGKIRLPGWDGEIMRYCYSEYLGQYYNSPLLGPEGMANRATVEECKGLCPVILVTSEHDVDRDSCIHFALKLYEAGVYCDLHVYSGGSHGSTAYKVYPEDTDREMSPKMTVNFSEMINIDVTYLLKDDLRRPWTAE